MGKMFFAPIFLRNLSKKAIFHCVVNKAASNFAYLRKSIAEKYEIEEEKMLEKSEFKIIIHLGRLNGIVMVLRRFYVEKSKSNLIL